jgi:hypothetical protein
MKYYQEHLKLKNLFSTMGTRAEHASLEVHKLNFESHSSRILPGAESYYCNHHNIALKENFSFHNDIGRIKDNVQIKDYHVEENRRFAYHLLKPKNSGKVKKVIFLLHGFNEKSWDKYLPWAKTICEGTNSAVVLFPTAFHMQRAPQYWSEKRKMFLLSESRKKRFPNVVNSTLSNVAISMRLHAMPQRFIWSGLQTYYDFIQFIEDCKDDKHDHIHKDFTFNIFAYSIGGLLAQILKLSNHRGYFSSSKVCLFCGGAVFNRLSPVSKFIIDSEANVALYSFLIEHFESFLQKDNLLNHYLNEGHMEGEVFHSMLDYQKMRDFREELFKNYEDHFYAIPLKKDRIVPSFEVVNTLKGAYRNINIQVDELDFDHPYTHENPFPVQKAGSKKVNQSFSMVFEKVCDFLK